MRSVNTPILHFPANGHKLLISNLFFPIQLHSQTKLSISFRFQLASASQNLHSIFVKMPMVERMDLIAKDREWQQFKMNRSKSSDNNKNHMFVNGNSHLARSQSARFEKKFWLNTQPASEQEIRNTKQTKYSQQRTHVLSILIYLLNNCILSLLKKY